MHNDPTPTRMRQRLPGAGLRPSGPGIDFPAAGYDRTHGHTGPRRMRAPGSSRSGEAGLEGPGLQVPVALVEAGLPEHPRSDPEPGRWSSPAHLTVGDPWPPTPSWRESAMVAGLSDDQWRAFGATLRGRCMTAVSSGYLPDRSGREDFAFLRRRAPPGCARSPRAGRSPVRPRGSSPPATDPTRPHRRDDEASRVTWPVTPGEVAAAGALSWRHPRRQYPSRIRRPHLAGRLGRAAARPRGARPALRGSARASPGR